STDLYVSYKGKTAELLNARRNILDALESRNLLAPICPSLRETIIADPGGDALDAVIAAVGVGRSIQHPQFPRIDWHGDYRHEAMVYL
ncbi:MAG: hypothetical protein K0U93_15460, partial [Gammaproteobacteria bacterium]|nr:hypothetical protein [Gammaproteobacteria bacterium]